MQGQSTAPIKLPAFTFNEAEKTQYSTWFNYLCRCNSINQLTPTIIKQHMLSIDNLHPNHLKNGYQQCFEKITSFDIYNFMSLNRLFAAVQNGINMDQVEASASFPHIVRLKKEQLQKYSDSSLGSQSSFQAAISLEKPVILQSQSKVETGFAPVDDEQTKIAVSDKQLIMQCLESSENVQFVVNKIHITKIKKQMQEITQQITQVGEQLSTIVKQPFTESLLLQLTQVQEVAYSQYGQFQNQVIQLQQKRSNELNKHQLDQLEESLTAQIEYLQPLRPTLTKLTNVSGYMQEYVETQKQQILNLAGQLQKLENEIVARQEDKRQIIQSFTSQIEETRRESFKTGFYVGLKYASAHKHKEFQPLTVEALPAPEIFVQQQQQQQEGQHQSQVFKSKDFQVEAKNNTSLVEKELVRNRTDSWGQPQNQVEVAEFPSDDEANHKMEDSWTAIEKVDNAQKE